jgi:hypothetical protein
MWNMKKIIKYFAILLVTVLSLTSCEDWLDVNTDPNAIVDGPAITENIMLIGVEAEWAATAIVRFPWYGSFSDWFLWYGIEASTPATFNIAAGFANDIWGTYAGSLKHAVQLYDKAEANGNTYYQGIAAVIAAWHWFYIADVYDKAPLDEAMKGGEFFTPAVADQEDIYAHAEGLLDEAIGFFGAADGGDRVPTGTDDYMLGGDIDKWMKLAYSLKARQAMRLIYAPGKSKTTQADLVLSYLSDGMTTNDDICEWKHLDDLANAGWFYNDWVYDYSGEGQTPTNFLVDMMNSFNDPRRYIMFTFAEADPTGFIGIKEGATVVPGNKPSRYKSSYAVKSYPDHIMVYAETRFLTAEAYVLKGQWALAETAMKAGIRADMEYMGVPEADITTYLAQPSLTMPTNEEAAQELIIGQKYIANIYETNETYFDFIRTGYPDFDFAYAITNVYNTTTFPRRFPYPLDELEKNPSIAALGQPDWFEKGTTWDAKAFSWRTK